MAGPATVVYVSNAGNKEIGVFLMDRDSGALTAIERVPVPGTDKPSPTSMPLAVSPDRRFLYAALRSEPYPVVELCDRPGRRPTDPSRVCAVGRQHGLYHHRPQRPLSA